MIPLEDIDEMVRIVKSLADTEPSEKRREKMQLVMAIYEQGEKQGRQTDKRQVQFNLK